VQDYFKIIIIGGPTASGKSQYALELAKLHNGVIINADSVQLYREIPIISAQPSLDEQSIVPHFLYGVFEAQQVSSVGIWLELVRKIIDEAINKNQTPIVVGGTGLYLKSLVYGISQIEDIDLEIRKNARGLHEELGNEKFYALLRERDPLMAEKIRPNDKQRMIRAFEVINQTGKSLHFWHQQPNISFYPVEQFKQILLMPERSELYRNCDMRFMQMIEHGALLEVQNLLEYHDGRLHPMKATGVKELARYLRDEITLEEAIKAAQQATRNYAKRQFTWFRHQLPDSEIVVK
jgi:tRNA dimethylallyltransferase